MVWGAHSGGMGPWAHSVRKVFEDYRGLLLRSPRRALFDYGWHIRARHAEKSSTMMPETRTAIKGAAIIAVVFIIILILSF